MRRGELMGIGLAAFVDKAGTGPSDNLAKRGGLHGGWESAIVRVHSDGKVTVLSGSHSHGQGHDITFCQIAADRLGLPIDDIRLLEGDTETGAVALRAFYAADDCGVIINPMIVEGQVHGGLAQGIGQALGERIVYDDSGQLLTASFLDYAMPRASDLPAFHTAFIA